MQRKEEGTGGRETEAGLLVKQRVEKYPAS